MENQSTLVPEHLTTAERPILFTGSMVNALLNGTKTQTRRVVKDIQLRNGLNSSDEYEAAAFVQLAKTSPVACPYGQVFDRLWVRESWQKYSGTDYIHYRANGEQAMMVWRSPIFMPRWASRITLEIADIRVEQVQDISNEDAIAEGASGLFPELAFRSYRAEFAHLWESINGKKAGCDWQSNPWCGASPSKYFSDKARLCMSCFAIAFLAVLAGVVLGFSFAACHWRVTDKKNKGYDQ